MIPKFRAWNKADREMIPWNRLLNGHNLRNVFMRPEMCGLVLMQSTGLKDENGLEIFEGDVYEDGDSKRHVVTFKKGGFGRVGRFLINYHTNESIVTHEPLINDVIDGCEVIGNIYQNPELLEGE